MTVTTHQLKLSMGCCVHPVALLKRGKISQGNINLDFYHKIMDLLLILLNGMSSFA